MAKVVESKIKKSSWLDYVRIVVYGIIFMIVAFVLSGDTSSVALGLLVMYLEYRFMNLQKVKK